MKDYVAFEHFQSCHLFQWRNPAAKHIRTSVKMHFKRTVPYRCSVGLVGFALLDIKASSWHNASLKQLESVVEMKWRIKGIVGCDDIVLSLY